jgi:DnaJ-class molecular chaperone
MSGGSRAVSATTSRRAKQELVRLLFGEQYTRKGPEAHRKLDHSIYSYKELRKAYLGRLQEIHPDKNKSKELESHHIGRLQRSFNELQEAWDNYEILAKMMKVSKGDEMDANFTLFGVGCSFSDSPAERGLREEIMDQACRGWFSSGALAESDDKKHEKEAKRLADLKKIPLADDDMFMAVDETNEYDESNASETAPKKRSLATLIPGLKIRR